MKLFYSFLMQIFAAQCLFGQQLIEELPNLSTFTNSYLFSSTDPNGRNSDGFEGGNYLYETNRGSINVNHPSEVLTDDIEYVMVDVVGKGALKRFWNARYEITDTVRFYVDGSKTPQIEMTLDEIFYQKLPPFHEGLTYSYSENSGALYTYVPIFFDSSLIVTIDNPIGYYHFNVDLYGDESEIESEPLDYYSDLKDIFENAGNRPESLANATWDSLTFNLTPNSEINLFDKIGSYTIKGVEIEIPSIDNVNSTNLISDEMKVSGVKNSFKLKVNQEADTYKLRFRYLRKIGRNSVFVFINDTYLGVWEVNPVSIRDNIWLDYEFNIPSALASQNDSIKIEFRPIEFDWSGFTYWMMCDDTITDSLDVGVVESEMEHQFFSEEVNLSTTMKGRYAFDTIAQNLNTSILQNLVISGFWDNETTPSIDAPISYFFGMGAKDAPISNGICFGLNENGFYNYFPMPFEKNGKLNLKNVSDSLSIQDIKVRIAYSSENNESIGNLHASFKSFNTDRNDGDITLLNEIGQGKIVGIVLNGNGPEIKWLEGDERVYIDGLKTPFTYGTGTEDIFNGGDYFLLGERDLPIGSLNYFDRNYANMFRTYVSDPIIFRDGIVFNLQRGATNNVEADYNSLVFYYSRDATSIYSQTDYFNITEDVDSIKYNYLQYGGSYFNQAGKFEGTYDDEVINNKGYQGIDSSEFIVNIPSNNGGIVVTRGMNYENLNQSAEVYVNNRFVGVWSTSGKNESKTWREDLFMIPAFYTSGSNTIKIQMKAISDNWSEMYYRINTIYAEPTLTSIDENSLTNGTSLNASIHPNPMNNKAILTFEESMNLDIYIVDIQGKLARVYRNFKGNKIEIEKGELSKGTYFVNLINVENPFIQSTLKLIIN